MNNLKLTLSILATSIFSLALCATTQAQSRTFVSINGNDANLCTAPSPCRTFQRAHDVVAIGGEVVALDSGGFGAVTITKSVTITGDGVHAGITATLATNGVTIDTAGVTVNLRSLTIEGVGTGATGIGFLNGTALHVENCVIDGFINSGILFQPTSAAELFVKDTIARNHSIGVFVGNPGAVASIDHCRFENNSNIGLFVTSSAKATVRNSVAAQNGDGLRASASELNIDSCVSANNTNNGVLAEAIATVRVANSTVTNNGVYGLLNSSATLLSRVTGTADNVFTNTVEGNLFDLGGDPIGTYTAK